MSNQSGFTLMEIVTVMVVIGILAVTAAPAFVDLTDKAEATATTAELGVIYSALSMHKMINGSYPDKLSNVVLLVPNIDEKYSYNPEGGTV